MDNNSLNHHCLFWIVSQDMDFCQIIGTSCTNMWKLRLPTKMKSLVDGCLPRLSLSSSSSFPWLLPTCRGCGEAKISILHEENLNLRWQLYERDSNVNTLFPLKKMNKPGVPVVGEAEMNLISFHEEVDSISRLAQWVRDPGLPWALV